ncbi:MAG: hypothetical protein L0Z48_00595 [candidate division Zixibacteria bacterium]|nr:hypothetical protein [candidate division Zixibacteria bacterium]MCI0595022.1 hypothetical protein [candidate division Zixibacteria bacterium]
MKKWMLKAGLLALLVNFACDSNSPTGSVGNANPPGPNPAPPFQGIIFAIQNGGAKFQLAAFTGDTLNIRTDKNTQIFREGVDAQLQSADLQEGDEASVEGVYQGAPKEKTIKAGYIFLYSAP